MKEEIVYTLIRAIIPDLFDNLFNKINCFRLFQIKLPDLTNQEELFSEIKKIPETNKLWSVMKEGSAQGEKDFFIVFFNKKKSFFDPNWPQITSVFYKEDNTQEKILIIRSQFSQNQIIERGVLTKNCNIVMETIKNYFDKKGVDISENIEKAEVLKDSISKSFLNKNIFPWKKP